MRNLTRFAPGRRLDVICLGRLAVDLCAQQIGARLEDVSSFAKYPGGSSANIALGCARLGLRSAMISRVGDDHMGRFLTETLAREGCDVSHVSSDPNRLTALVVLGINYGQDCADMAIDEADVDEAFIASSKALLITGTHFSTPHVHRLSTLALDHARRNDVRTILDIDYRPVLWGLTQKGEGENRFVSSDRVTAHLQAILPRFDLVAGTQEEFMAAGGSRDIIASLKAVRQLTPATLVIKRGALGSAVIDGEVPDRLEDAFNWRGVELEVLNVLGAGDGFMAGFLRGWLNGADYEICCREANACGALVASRHACAPAMPTAAELDYFLANADRLKRPDQDPVLTRLHRVTVPRRSWPELLVFAFDHRIQLFELAREAGQDESRLPRLKRLLLEAFTQSEEALQLQGRAGVLVDDRYGQDALDAATGRGWWVGRPVELPGSNPLEFDRGRSVGTHLISWPQEQVVKCLVRFHPDDGVENRIEQETQLRTLHDAVQVSGHELLLEVIPPKHPPRAEDTVYRAMKRLYNVGIRPEWWKLEPMSGEAWRMVEALIEERDPACRGVLLLGLGARIEDLAAAFREARQHRCCRGFAVGRTVFQEPSRNWLAGEIDDVELIVRVRANLEELIRAWERAGEPRGKEATWATRSG